MRLSTKLLIAAVAAGAVGSALLTVYANISSARLLQTVISDKNPVTITLDSFSALKITTINDNCHLIRANDQEHQYKGVVIEESDSVTTPELRTSEEWSRIIRCTGSGDTLHMTFDFNIIKDSLDNKNTRLLWIGSESRKPSTLVVPRGMLKEVETDQYNIYLNKFDGGTIKADVYYRNANIYHSGFITGHKKYPGWLMVNEGRLDSITCKYPLEGLRLYKSTVGATLIPMKDIHLTIMCKEPGDSVGGIHIIPDGGIHRSGELDLTRARIGSLYLPPHDSVNFVLNLSINRPISIKEMNITEQ